MFIVLDMVRLEHDDLMVMERERERETETETTKRACESAIYIG